MTRAIKKAQIPVWYTEGFNPHPYMTFSMPLSLGHESLCESFDIRLTVDCSFEDIKNRFNAVLPEGIKVTNVAPARFKPTEIDKADYRIVFYGVNEAFAKKLSNFLARENIIVEKTGKKGKISQIDLASKIIGQNVTIEDDRCVLNVTLPSGTTENINPALLLGAFGDTLIEMPCLDIVRLKLYCGEDEYI